MRKHRLNLPAITCLILSLSACNFFQLMQAPLPTETPTPAAVTTPAQTAAPSTPIEATDKTPATSTRQPDLMTITPLEPGQAVTIASITMFTPDSGWAAGGLDQSTDHILLTKDGGSTWFDRTPPASLPVEYIPARAHSFFFDIGHAWVSYSGSSDVWFTTNGGQSWQSSLAGYAHAHQDRIFFSDSDHGWLLRSVEAGMGSELVALYRSRDGGANWELLIDPYEDEALQGCFKTGMAFNGAEIGWITYDCQGTYPEPFMDITQDGGETWSTTALPTPERELDLDLGDFCSTKSPTLFSPDAGALIVQCVSLQEDELLVQHTLFLTRDGGTTWQQSDLPGEDVFFLNDQNVFALGRDLYYSSSAGQTWRKVKVLAWDGRFSFVDENLGWAVATAEDAIALVFTTDGGTKWTELMPSIAQP